MLAISSRKAAITPKPAGGLGKFEAEPVYLGNRETKRDPIGETIRITERQKSDARHLACFAVVSKGQRVLYFSDAQ